MNHRRKSILGKMLVGISVPVILVMVCAGVLILSKVNKTVSALSEDKLTSDSKAAAYQVSEFFTEFLSGIHHAATSTQFESYLKRSTPEADTRLNLVAGYTDIKETLIKMASADTENIQASWIADFDTSQITQSDNFTSAPGWDITSRPWYIVKETRMPVLTEPYNDVSTGNLIVTAAAPVFDRKTQEAIGAIGYDISLEHLNSKLKNFTIGENGFIILTTSEGQVIYHPDAENIGKNVSETNWPDQVKQAFLSDFKGNLQYELDGIEYFGSMNVVESGGWYVMTGLPMSEIMEAYYSTLKTIIIIFAIVFIILILVIYLISRGISMPVKELARISNQLAAGDLNIKVNINSSDETGLVAEAMGKTVKRLSSYIDYIDEISQVLDQIAGKDLVFELKYDYSGEFSKVKTSLLNIKKTLNDTLEHITRTSFDVASGASHISAGAQNMAQGATEQASSVEELAASISELSTQVNQNAKDAESADMLISQTVAELTASNHQMQKLREAMENINSSSGEIGKVIKTIEDIAFQTNILALNAAVEAARAGASGKGFAVVADEVRNLASKSSDAAKETTQMIEASIRSVHIGNQLANEAAETMLKLVSDSGKTTAAIRRISEATSSQAAAISQVSLGIEQISGVVQNNSATAEESAAASEQLSSQSQILKQLTEEFHLED